MPGAQIWAAATAFPTPWVILASVFCGAGVARVTRRTRGSRDPEAARSRSWVVFVVCMCGVVSAWLLAVFVPGPEKIAHLKYLPYFVGVSLVLAVGFRFPKSAGLALVVCLVAAGAAGYILSTAMDPLAPDGTLGRVVVYAVDAAGVDLEVRLEGRPPTHARLGGDRVAPLVTTIRFDDLWPGLGWRTWCRIEGVGAFRVVGQGSGRSVAWGPERYLVTRDEGAPELLYRLLESHAASVPGVRVIRSDSLVADAALSDRGSDYGRVEALAEYLVRARATGEAAVEATGR